MISSNVTLKPAPTASVEISNVPTANVSLRGGPYASSILIYEDLLGSLYDVSGDINFSADYLQRARLLIPPTSSLVDLQPTNIDSISDVLFEEDTNGDIQPKF